MPTMNDDFAEWFSKNVDKGADAVDREQAFLAGYEKGVEAAAKVTCKSCADGIDKPGRCRNHWHHYAESPSADAEEGDMCIVSDCQASKIRNLLPNKDEL